MKRTLILIGSVLLVLSLFAACGGGSNGAFPEASENVKVAEDEFDSHGWKGKIAINFEEGDIASVQYDELNKDGDLKSKDEGYAENMQSASGVTPAEAFEQLQQQLVKSENPAEVDVVSGATSSSERFKELAEKALSE
jgi:major membrane immunogen (membrane-anchored lipoprotein)